MPSRTVTLLPSPRAIGISPLISQENSKALHCAAAKNFLAASRIIALTTLRLPRLTVILLYRESATPRQSKPGPRFEVLAGTRNVTCCTRRAYRARRTRQDRRGRVIKLEQQRENEVDRARFDARFRD